VTNDTFSITLSVQRSSQLVSLSLSPRLFGLQILVLPAICLQQISRVFIKYINYQTCCTCTTRI